MKNLFTYGGIVFIVLVAGWSILYWESSRADEEPKAATVTRAVFGGTPARNMANLVDRNVPIDWSVEEGKNIKWSAQLGSKSYAGPVIAGGKVYVGTNNASPREKNVKGSHKAVLMCFSEKDGSYLWQAAHDIPGDDIFREALEQGLCSTPCVEGDRVYYVTPSCEVICASTADGKAVWRYDMMKELKVI